MATPTTPVAPSLRRRSTERSTAARSESALRMSLLSWREHLLELVEHEIELHFEKCVDAAYPDVELAYRDRVEAERLRQEALREVESRSRPAADQAHVEASPSPLPRGRSNLNRISSSGVSKEGAAAVVVESSSSGGGSHNTFGTAVAQSQVVGNETMGSYGHLTTSMFSIGERGDSTGSSAIGTSFGTRGRELRLSSADRTALRQEAREKVLQQYPHLTVYNLFELLNRALWKSAGGSFAIALGTFFNLWNHICAPQFVLPLPMPPIPPASAAVAAAAARRPSTKRRASGYAAAAAAAGKKRGSLLPMELQAVLSPKDLFLHQRLATMDVTRPPSDMLMMDPFGGDHKDDGQSSAAAGNQSSRASTKVFAGKKKTSAAAKTTKRKGGRAGASANPSGAATPSGVDPPRKETCPWTPLPAVYAQFVNKLQYILSTLANCGLGDCMVRLDTSQYNNILTAFGVPHALLGSMHKTEALIAFDKHCDLRDGSNKVIHADESVAIWLHVAKTTGVIEELAKLVFPSQVVPSPTVPAGQMPTSGAHTMNVAEIRITLRKLQSSQQYAARVSATGEQEDKPAMRPFTPNSAAPSSRRPSSDPSMKITNRRRVTIVVAGEDGTPLAEAPSDAPPSSPTAAPTAIVIPSGAVNSSGGANNSNGTEGGDSAGRSGVSAKIAIEKNREKKFDEFCEEVLKIVQGARDRHKDEHIRDQLAAASAAAAEQDATPQSTLSGKESGKKLTPRTPASTRGGKPQPPTSTAKRQPTRRPLFHGGAKNSDHGSNAATPSSGTALSPNTPQSFNTAELVDLFLLISEGPDFFTASHRRLCIEPTERFRSRELQSWVSLTEIFDPLYGTFRPNDLAKLANAGEAPFCTLHQFNVLNELLYDTFITLFLSQYSFNKEVKENIEIGLPPRICVTLDALEKVKCEVAVDEGASLLRLSHIKNLAPTGLVTLAELVAIASTANHERELFQSRLGERATKMTMPQLGAALASNNGIVAAIGSISGTDWKRIIAEVLNIEMMTFSLTFRDNAMESDEDEMDDDIVDPADNNKLGVSTNVQLMSFSAFQEDTAVIEDYIHADEDKAAAQIDTRHNEHRGSAEHDGHPSGRSNRSMSLFSADRSFSLVNPDILSRPDGEVAFTDYLNIWAATENKQNMFSALYTTLTAEFAQRTLSQLSVEVHNTYLTLLSPASTYDLHAVAMAIGRLLDNLDAVDDPPALRYSSVGATQLLDEETAGNALGLLRNITKKVDTWTYDGIRQCVSVIVEQDISQEVWNIFLYNIVPQVLVRNGLRYPTSKHQKELNGSTLVGIADVVLFADAYMSLWFRFLEFCPRERRRPQKGVLPEANGSLGSAPSDHLGTENGNGGAVSPVSTSPLVSPRAGRQLRWNHVSSDAFLLAFTGDHVGCCPASDIATLAKRVSQQVKGGTFAQYLSFVADSQVERVTSYVNAVAPFTDNRGHLPAAQLYHALYLVGAFSGFDDHCGAVGRSEGDEAVLLGGLLHSLGLYQRSMATELHNEELFDVLDRAHELRGKIYEASDGGLVAMGGRGGLFPRTGATWCTAHAKYTDTLKMWESRILPALHIPVVHAILVESPALPLCMDDVGNYARVARLVDDLVTAATTSARKAPEKTAGARRQPRSHEVDNVEAVVKVVDRFEALVASRIGHWCGGSTVVLSIRRELLWLLSRLGQRDRDGVFYVLNKAVHTTYATMANVVDMGKRKPTAAAPSDESEEGEKKDSTTGEVEGGTLTAPSPEAGKHGQQEKLAEQTSSDAASTPTLMDDTVADNQEETEEKAQLAEFEQLFRAYDGDCFDFGCKRHRYTGAIGARECIDAVRSYFGVRAATLQWRDIAPFVALAEAELDQLLFPLSSLRARLLQGDEDALITLPMQYNAGNAIPRRLMHRASTPTAGGSPTDARRSVFGHPAMLTSSSLFNSSSSLALSTSLSSTDRGKRITVCVFRRVMQNISDIFARHLQNPMSLIWPENHGAVDTPSPTVTPATASLETSIAGFSSSKSGTGDFTPPALLNIEVEAPSPSGGSPRHQAEEHTVTISASVPIVAADPLKESGSIVDSSARFSSTLERQQGVVQTMLEQVALASETASLPAVVYTTGMLHYWFNCFHQLSRGKLRRLVRPHKVSDLPAAGNFMSCITPEHLSLLCDPCTAASLCRQHGQQSPKTGLGLTPSEIGCKEDRYAVDFVGFVEGFLKDARCRANVYYHPPESSSKRRSTSSRSRSPSKACSPGTSRGGSPDGVSPRSSRSPSHTGASSTPSPTSAHAPVLLEPPVGCTAREEETHSQGNSSNVKDAEGSSPMRESSVSFVEF